MPSHTASPDRARRRKIKCSCCKKAAAHKGHGLCIACWTRWVYHGRLEGGPPKAQTRPSVPEQFEDYEWLRQSGESRGEIARRMGISIQSLPRYEMLSRAVNWPKAFPPRSHSSSRFAANLERVTTR